MYSLCIWMYHWGGPIRQSPITSRLDHKAAFQLSGRGKASGFCGGSTVTQSNGQATGSKGAGKKKKTAHSNHLSSSSSQPASQPGREGLTSSMHGTDGRTGLTSSHLPLLPEVQMQQQLLHTQSDSMDRASPCRQRQTAIRLPASGLPGSHHAQPRPSFWFSLQSSDHLVMCQLCAAIFSSVIDSLTC